MTKLDGVVTCHWLTPTRIMPHPFCFEADARPWSCLRDGRPGPLNAAELRRCATCSRWESRTLDAVKRDLAFETWGSVFRFRPSGRSRMDGGTSHGIRGASKRTGRGFL